ncbi:MAG TPA: NAD(P)H-hydrate dehydratase [Allosphingosinicella sp.]
MSTVETLDRSLLERFPLPDHPERSSKEDRGRLLVVAGSRELPGAAYLAAVAGLRAGAGKLQIATARSIAVQLGVAIPEARVVGHGETEEGSVDPADIDSIVSLAKNAGAVTIGCGMQSGESLERLLDAMLDCGARNVPLVLDAAVLGCLAPRAETLRIWPGGAVILPHAGEMASLLGCEREEIEAEPEEAARRAAETLGVVAVIKGPVSFIVAPDGRSFRFEGGGVGLATSGSGDTLAGIVGGFAARGADALTAALWGVYTHGEAGRTLTDRVGRIGFLAREILDLIPSIVND